MYKPTKCAKCAYSAVIGITSERYDGCFYVLRAGKRRGCPGGKDCTKFLKRSKSNQTIWNKY